VCTLGGNCATSWTVFFFSNVIGWRHWPGLEIGGLDQQIPSVGFQSQQSLHGSGWICSKS
jgi:hypothetical protein